MQAASSSKPHEGGIAANGKSPSATTVHQTTGRAAGPVVVGQANAQTGQESGHDSSRWPPAADWALVYTTVILVIATVLLWLATRRLFKEARNTAIQQLRAYIYIKHIQPHSEAVQLTRIPALRVVIKNFGQTPAYHLRVLSGTVVDVIGTPTRLSTPTVLDKGSKHSAGPGATINHVTDPVVPTPAELALIEARTHRLYVFGVIQYEDAFGDVRRETFRHSLNPDTLGLEIEPEGNASFIEPKKISLRQRVAKRIAGEA